MDATQSSSCTDENNQLNSAVPNNSNDNADAQKNKARRNAQCASSCNISNETSNIDNVSNQFVDNDTKDRNMILNRNMFDEKDEISKIEKDKGTKENNDNNGVSNDLFCGKNNGVTD